MNNDINKSRELLRKIHKNYQEELYKTFLKIDKSLETLENKDKKNKKKFPFKILIMFLLVLLISIGLIDTLFLNNQILNYARGLFSNA